MDSASLVGWLTLLLLAVNAVLVWLYLGETKKIRIANEAQLEAQISPAVVVRLESFSGGISRLALVNLGKGPALHLRLSATVRGSIGKRELDRLTADIGFIEVNGKYPTNILTQGGTINTLDGQSFQCQYMSLSGRTYFTVVDFDRADNNLLIATHVHPEER
jgi:hypothetical protein